jgi:gliding motility-associated-like protein
MRPNRGQWDSRILYKLDLDYGDLLIEGQGLTYQLFDLKIHEAHHVANYSPKFHVIKTHFLGSNLPKNARESKISPHYRNYFIGQDSAKWKTNIHDIQEVQLQALYLGVDILYSSENKQLKYSLVVQPNTNPNTIKIQIEGANHIELKENGNLEISSIFGKIIESKPVAYSLKNGKKRPVKCDFSLNKNVLQFKLGQYSTADTLIIDPSLVFSSFTGSLSDNWGFTACSDTAANLFAGGIVFGAGYPTTAGVFDASYNPGNGSISQYHIDIGITKFNATGTALLYSTYLGGTGNETPNSIVCNKQGELFVMGPTSSNDFPVSATALQNTFAGGTSTTQNSLAFTPDGSDLFITRISASGNAILASTYLGGTDNEALNYGSSLKFNYGDQFRGMVEVDTNSNVYFSSTTHSNNFPTVNSSTVLSGAQDAIYGKLNSSLSSADFIAYYGGSGYEAGNAIQLSNAGDIYLVGGTTSSDLPQSALGLNPNYLGGSADGFVAKINPLTGTVTSSTYLGTNDYDQAYFVQLDLNDKVYVLGQTRGNYPISSGVYNNPNSGQFIHKLSNNLSTSDWSTSIGASSGWEEISPTAFLVSDCFDIYLSGWGGQVNSQYSSATHSTSNNMPITANAYQSTTNGNNFYIAMLKKDAVSLKFATYFGGVASSENHVDGGTSQFDKNGSIYHAVCGACGGNDYGFTTTPGVWSQTNNSNNCNLAAFKFELNILESTIGNLNPIICMPQPVVFVNNSQNGNLFEWNFGDGTTSMQENPTHSYANSGNYTVSLIVIDTTNCHAPDTSYFNIFLDEFHGSVQSPPSSVCPGDTLQLHAAGGTSYVWSPANLIVDSATTANPFVSITQNTTFQVIVSDSCGSDTLSVDVNVFNSNFDIIGDTNLCLGDTLPLSVNASGFSSISWFPDSIFIDSHTNPALAIPTSSCAIQVELTSSDGCKLTASHTIFVDSTLPKIQLPKTRSYCKNIGMDITVSGASSYIWSPNYYISSTTSPHVFINSPVDTTYYLQGFNSCGNSIDTLHTHVIETIASAGNDTIICPGESAMVWASGGVKFEWEPMAFASNPTDSISYVFPNKPTHFMAIVTDSNGCIDTAVVFVNLFPTPSVYAGIDYYGLLGDEIPLEAKGSGMGTYTWKPSEYLSCVNCQFPHATPPKNFTYIVEFTDTNGCIAHDDVSIFFNGILYVPNSFTPNSGEYNNIFKAEGGNMQSFNLKIFDRWGEIIFEANDINTGWNGTYKGLPCQDGVYVWKIRYVDIETKIPKEIYGHVSLLR